MKTLIVSLTETLFDGETTSCVVPTKNGEITILKNHRPLVSILGSGTATITNETGEILRIPIRAGFLEVSADNTVHILLD